MSGPIKHRVHMNNLSKTQMARIINDQSTLVEQMTKQLRRTSQALIAIVLEPDAFHPQTNGRARVESSALQRVKAGHVLNVGMRNGICELQVVEPGDAPCIELADIVLPEDLQRPEPIIMNRSRG